MASMNPDFKKLVAKLYRLHLLREISEHLGWDEQVNLPSGSGDLRSEESAIMSELGHREASAAPLGRLIESLEAKSGELSDDEAIVVRQARRDFDEAVKLPKSFVHKKALSDSHGFQVWQTARQTNNFKLFEPVLHKQIELAAKQAELLGRGADAYSYWVDHFDQGSNEAMVAEIFGPLEAELAPLARQIAERYAKIPPKPLRGFGAAAQKEFALEVVKAMGFDFAHGRVDVAMHPFCNGDGRDTRITTHYREDTPLDSVFSAVHECGHALYEQGLPAGWAGTALGDSAGMATHESQSRIWENQVARSRAFWKFYEPRYRAKFPDQTAAVSSQELFDEIKRVKLSLVRLDADEVSYNLHIILRFNLERALFSGQLAPRDIPAAWEAQSERLLGLKPSTVAQGCMQDVHWACGLFGYFPSYALGNILAAGLWQKARADLPNLEAQIASGELSGMLKWLRQNVHCHARRLSVWELSQKVCGKPLSPETFIAYVKERYLGR
jgi:carboxypeptidase Taq